MNMRAKGIVTLGIVFCAAVLQGQEWKEDAKRAENYAAADDYNAAWLFYKRVLARGCDDGLIIYRAAEALSRQSLGEDASLAKELYAVASYYLAEQNPESPALAAANLHVEDNVKRGKVAQTYAKLGARLPSTYGFTSTKFDAVKIFLVSSFEETMQMLTTLVSKGPRVTLVWIRSRMPNLLLSVFVASLLTGIVLPCVMAVMVAREGRKSYVSAYALLIHWGFLGIHRFYLGRYASGLLWLFTGGLFGLGVFLDLFLTGALVRFWNEDNRSERFARRKVGNAGNSPGYRRGDMRGRTSGSRISPNVYGTDRRSERAPESKKFAATGPPDMEHGENFKSGTEKF